MPGFLKFRTFSSTFPETKISMYLQKENVSRHYTLRFFCSLSGLENLSKDLLFKLCVSGACFSKVPELYGPFSGVTIPVVSQERRRLHSQFAFCYLENMLKDQNKRLAVSQMPFRARKVFGSFEKQAPGHAKSPLFVSFEHQQGLRDLL